MTRKPSADKPEPLFTTDLTLERRFKKAAQKAHQEEHPQFFERYGSFPTAFIHTPHLPVTRPGNDVDIWKHEANGGKVTLRKGLYIDRNGEEKAEWAYGGIPRYLLAAVMSQALRQESQGEDPRHIDLSETLYRFIKEHGLSNSGQTRRTITTQLQTLFSSPFTYLNTESYENRKRLQLANVNIAQSIDIWVPNGVSTGEKIEPHITLSNEMIQLLRTGSAAPMRLDIYAQLVKSPFAMDILNWLGIVTYHLAQANEKEAAALYEWEYLSAHFVHNYTRLVDFRGAFKRAVKRIKTDFYPDLEIDCDYPHPVDKRKTAVAVYKSKLLIPKKQQRALGL